MSFPLKKQAVAPKKQFAELIGRFAGHLADHRYWEVSLCGETLTLFVRKSYTYREKHAVHTTTRPVLYLLAITNSRYENGKYIIVNPKSGLKKVDLFQHHRLGAIWQKFDTLGRLPTQEELEMF